MAMERDNLKSDSINFQWGFYERAINNYSIIMRMLHYVEEEDSLIHNIPRILVEGSIFDMCKIVRHDNGKVREGFFSIEESLASVDLDAIRSVSAGAFTPSVLRDTF